jgi:uncharacterized protein YjbI with pentapeptide repeats
VANAGHLLTLKQGAEIWNQFRSENPTTVPDLSSADLRGADLRGADLRGADLSGATLSRADLTGADLREADLDGATIYGADLSEADLRKANLRDAVLVSIENLAKANLRDATFSEGTVWPQDFNPDPHGALYVPRFDLHGEQKSSLPDELAADFTITFASSLSPEQIRGTLQALADYYRACGGVGFEIDFELEDVRVGVLSHV